METAALSAVRKAPSSYPTMIGGNEETSARPVRASLLPDRMKEPHRKGRATHPDPESCASRRKVAGEALTGAHAGQVLSSEICLSSGVPTSFWEAEGYIGVGESLSLLGTLRSHRP